MAPTSLPPAETIEWGEGAFALRFIHGPDAPVSLAGVILFGGTYVELYPMPVVEITTAESVHAGVSRRLAHTALGEKLRYASHERFDRDLGHELLITQTGGGLCVVLRLSVFPGIAAFRSSVVVTAIGDDVVVLRSVTSWSCGYTPRAAADDWELLSGRSEWLAEGRWNRVPLTDLVPNAAAQLTGQHPKSAVTRTAQGTWSTCGDLPAGFLESLSLNLAWGWQIEHNGPWRWDVSNDLTGGVLSLSGPTEWNASWNRRLGPGESFESVPAAVSVGTDWEQALEELTRLRRITHRRPALSSRVVFNDYMNTLNGDPTSAKLLPLIDAAATVGAEVFCIDAGWYADGCSWWDAVGAWEPSRIRFPGGFDEVIGAIKGNGMLPGLWLEPEVIGVRSPLADSLPREAFLLRHGQRLVEDGRHHLDLRHPAAQDHLDGTIDRLVGDLGIGYFKFDYNIDPGVGTDLDTDSLGDGLLQHNRAHLRWLDRLLERHPSLEIENCGAGAMRSDSAMLARLSLQSTSDQQDPLLYPPIAASAPLLMLPEQAANWAYPQPEMSDNLISFCLVTGLAGRLYLSGHLDGMSKRQLQIVRRAVQTARGLARHLRLATARYPFGVPTWEENVVVLEMRSPAKSVLFVWKREDKPEEVAITFSQQLNGPARDLTPLPADFELREDNLLVRLGQGPQAAVIEVPQF